MERTFVILKPSAVVRGLIGGIISRLEEKGLKIIALRMIRITREKAQELYAAHRGRPFYDTLIQHITSDPVVALVIEGEGSVNVVRKLIGNTDPKEALPGTIRGDFAMSMDKNVIHAADSLQSGQREIMIFFGEDELLSYQRKDEPSVY